MDDDEILDKADAVAETPEEAAEKIIEVTGADEGDTIEVTTPQFDRQDGIEPDEPPLTPSEFEMLLELPRERLKEMGLRPWDESGLMLLPFEWYPHIPGGVEVTSITGETAPFDPSEHAQTKRFGVLPFGIHPDE